MLRSLLALLILSAGALVAQQKATAPVPLPVQPVVVRVETPPSVKVEMPPTNERLHLIELIAPTVLSGGLVLFGVWLTNKNNRVVNSRNMAKEDRRLQQQRTWELKRDVLLDMAKKVSITHSAATAYAQHSRWLRAQESSPSTHPNELTKGRNDLSAFWIELAERNRQITEALGACCLCVSKETVDTIKECGSMLSRAHKDLSATDDNGVHPVLAVHRKYIEAFFDAARVELSGE